MGDPDVHREALPASPEDGDGDRRGGGGQIPGWPEGLLTGSTSALGSVPSGLPDDEASVPDRGFGVDGGIPLAALPAGGAAAGGRPGFLSPAGPGWERPVGWLDSAR